MGAPPPPLGRPDPDPAVRGGAVPRIIRGDQGTERAVWDRWWEDNERWQWGSFSAQLEIMTQLSPESDYSASFAEYAEIRGGRYFGDERSYVAGDHKYDPDKEIPGFTAWVEKYPGHPGQDDASYRLGRCFGIRGDLLRSLHWFRRAQEVPDGDMRSDARCWEALLLDALLSEDDLRVLVGRGDKQAEFSLRFRRLRRGDPTVTGLRGARDLARLIRAIDRAQGEEARAAALYNLGRLQYRNHSLYESSVWGEDRQWSLHDEGILWTWGHNGAPQAYRAARATIDNHLQARRTFLRLVEECPGSELVPKARYSAATALGHSASGHFEDRTAGCPQELRLTLGAEYLSIARDYPESTLADDALYFSGMFSGDPAVFEEILHRYPNGDMAEEAVGQRERALERRPLTIAELQKRVERVGKEPADSTAWEVQRAFADLEEHLTFCVLKLNWLRGEERKRAIGEFVSWFHAVKASLAFDSSIGAYVIR
jgi:hypothetical protein